MDNQKIMNSDQIGLSPYSKMEEDDVSQNQLNHGSSLPNISTNIRRFQWPHQWTLNECCCGCTVRTGSLAIGWSFMLISCFLLFGTLVGPFPAGFFRWEDLIFTFLKIVASITLLVGVYTHKFKVVRASVILLLIDLMVEVILAFIISIQIHHPMPILILLFALPLSVYLLVIVNSLANQMSLGLVINPQTGMNV